MSVGTKEFLSSRDNIVKVLEWINDVNDDDKYSDETITRAIDAAAAELRKTCATCGLWASWGGGLIFDCGHESGPEHMPQDGSGFCYRWEAKFSGPPANAEAVKP